MPDFTLYVLALSFYTRLPVRQDLDFARLPQASLCLPLVGWTVGGLCAVVFALAAGVWSPMIAVLLTMVAGIMATGAFHEDGFADACDGLGGGWDKVQALTIMQDSRLGTYGVIGVVLMLALKISILAAFPADATPWVLLAGHSVSRWPPLWLMFRFGYARTDGGKSGTAVFRPSSRGLMLAAICAVLPLFGLPGLGSLAIMPMGCVAWAFGGYCQRRIGGYTGDCLGACQQLSETVFYLGLAALWKFT